MATIYDRRVALAWLLEVAGVPVRWWAGQEPPAKSLGYGAGYYTDVKAILPDRLGAQVAELDELGGIGKHGAVSVVLGSRGSAAGAGDPRVVLCKAGKRGAARTTRLIETLEHDATGGITVVVSTDPTGWPQVGGRYVFHIGTEAFSATGLDTVAPYGFTGVDRAQFGGNPQEHLVALTRGLQPVVYSDPVTWRTRRAVLKAAPITGAALADGDYVEVCRGFIDQMPTLAADGLSVRLDIAPLTALLETTPGTGRVTKLVQGWHDFDGEAASTFAHTQFAVRGRVARIQIRQAYAAATGDLLVSTPEQWSENADTSLADEHPRRLPLRYEYGAGVELPTGTGIAGGGPSITVASANQNGTAGAFLINEAAWEPKTLTVSGLKRWPADVLAELREAWAPGQVADSAGPPAIAGAWVDVVPTSLNGSWVLQCRANGEALHDAFMLELRADWSLPGHYYHRDFWIEQPYTGWGVNEICWYGLQLCAPDGPWFDSRRQGAVGEYLPPGNRNRTVWVREEDVRARRGVDDAPDTIPIRGCPRAFYQTGEAAWLAEDAVISPGTTPQYVEVKASQGGREFQFATRVSDVDALTDGLGNTIGHTYSLAPGFELTTPAFGDWPGEPRAEIRPVAAFWRQKASAVLLRLLCSGRGRGTNGTPDVLPFGADIPLAHINVSSFAAFNAIPIRDEWSMLVRPDKPLKEVITPLLRAMGACLVMRRVGGVQKIGLAPVGVPTDESVAAINSATIAIDARPASEAENRVVTRYKLTANYPSFGDEPRVTGIFVDASAVSENGGDAGDELKLELRGWSVESGRDIVQEALPLVETLRARMGTPRRIYSFTIPRGLGMSLAVGDVVTLTAPDAVALDGSWGVSSLLCRVKRLEVMYSGERDGCEVTVTSYENVPAGWAPAMAVAATPTADTITITANAYSETTHPATGLAQTDADFFRVGDAVELVPPGDWAGRVTGKTIASISGTTVGITGHGASAGWTIRPAVYDSGTARMKGYVSAADTDAKLGAADDSAKDWS